MLRFKNLMNWYFTRGRAEDASDVQSGRFNENISSFWIKHVCNCRASRPLLAGVGKYVRTEDLFTFGFWFLEAFLSPCSDFQDRRRKTESHEPPQETVSVRGFKAGRRRRRVSRNQAPKQAQKCFMTRLWATIGWNQEGRSWTCCKLTSLAAKLSSS